MVRLTQALRYSNATNASRLLESKLFADCILECSDGVRIQAHRSILVRIRYFKAAFTANFKESQECVVAMEEDSKTVLLLLQYIYDTPESYCTNSERAHREVIRRVDDLDHTMYLGPLETSDKNMLSNLYNVVTRAYRELKTRLDGLDNMQVMRLLEASDKYMLSNLYDVLAEDVLSTRAKQAYENGLPRFEALIRELGLDNHPLREKLSPIFIRVMNMNFAIFGGSAHEFRYSLMDSFPWLGQPFLRRADGKGFPPLSGGIFAALCSRCADHCRKTSDPDLLEDYGEKPMCSHCSNYRKSPGDDPCDEDAPDGLFLLRIV